MSEGTRASRRHPARILGVLTALVVTAVVTTAVLERSQDDAAARPGVPASALSPSGTSLPDGFEVPDGTRLVGTPAQERSGDPARTSWRAVLLVDDDPLTAWGALLGMLGDVLSLDLDATSGCSDHDGLTCAVEAVGAPEGALPLVVAATIEEVEGDVTGLWSIVLTAESGGTASEGRLAAWPGGDAPEAPVARPRPDPGGPLADGTLAEGDDRDRYVLLPGSELLVQYSRGSPTGGFGVLLRVSPDAEVADVAAGYAEQARQFDGPVETSTTATATSTVTRLVPPGGAGGYQATIYAVDNVTGDDVVYYDLLND
ncbi:hypothetical protein [Oryzobacter terrae]|uniref:hypothetical protein n=1 Tax=Oryzobacter terrae TaxID=1620385 RepID=UPI00366A61CB